MDRHCDFAWSTARMHRAAGCSAIQIFDRDDLTSRHASRLRVPSEKASGRMTKPQPSTRLARRRSGQAVRQRPFRWRVAVHRLLSCFLSPRESPPCAGRAKWTPSAGLRVERQHEVSPGESTDWSRPRLGVGSRLPGVLLQQGSGYGNAVAASRLGCIESLIDSAQ